MTQLGLIPAGGRNGPIHRLRDQAKRLFASTIAYTYDASDRGEWHDKGFRLTNETHRWWNPAAPAQLAPWRSAVELSPAFFETVIDRPVPVDLRAIRTLRSPLALDVYTWLTYRNSYLHRPTEIPWEALHRQFRADYRRTRAFDGAFLRHARTVLTLYPAGCIEAHASGLLLKPARPHVPKA